MDKNKLKELLKEFYEYGFYDGIGDAKYGSACQEFEDHLKYSDEAINKLCKGYQANSKPANCAIFDVSGLLPDFGEVNESQIKIDLDDLKKCGWEYAKKWIEELREEKHQWANAYHNLKRALEGNNR